MGLPMALTVITAWLILVGSDSDEDDPTQLDSGRASLSQPDSTTCVRKPHRKVEWQRSPFFRVFKRRLDGTNRPGLRSRRSPAPSHRASRFRSCFGLMFGPSCTSIPAVTYMHGWFRKVSRAAVSVREPLPRESYR